jgi:hypothetical protein
VGGKDLVNTTLHILYFSTGIKGLTRGKGYVMIVAMIDAIIGVTKMERYRMYNGTEILYYIIPSDDNGDYAWVKTREKRTAIKVAKNTYREDKEEAGSNYQVNVFTGNADEPFTHLDPIFTKK